MKCEEKLFINLDEIKFENKKTRDIENKYYEYIMNNNIMKWRETVCSFYIFFFLPFDISFLTYVFSYVRIYIYVSFILLM